MGNCVADKNWFKHSGGSLYNTSRLPKGDECIATIYNFFISKGLTPLQVCGLMGSMKGEAGFDPYRRNSSSGALGIFQMLPSLFNVEETVDNNPTNVIGAVNAQCNLFWEKKNKYHGRKTHTYSDGSQIPGGYWEGRYWHKVFGETNHSLKYYVDAHTWTFERCTYSVATMQNRYKGANKIATIINQKCGTNIKLISDMTPVFAKNPDDPSSGNGVEDNGGESGGVNFLVMGREENSVGGGNLSGNDICQALISGETITIGSLSSSINGTIDLDEGDALPINNGTVKSQSWSDSTTKKARINELFGSDGLPTTESKSRSYAKTIEVVNKGKTFSVTVHNKLCNKIKAIFDEIDKTDYKIIGRSIPSFDWRFVKRRDGSYGSSRSNHAYGVAVDINGCPGSPLSANCNPYTSATANSQTSGDTDVKIRTWNHPVVAIFAKYGFGWGGAYGDFMHFSYFGGH